MNFANRTADVRFDLDAIQPADIARATNDLSFSPTIPASDPQPSSVRGGVRQDPISDEATRARSLRLKLTLVAALTLPLMILARSHGRIESLIGPRWTAGPTSSSSFSALR